MRRFDAYRIKRGNNLGSPDLWNRILEDLDIRLHARELDFDRIDTAIEALNAVGLQRITDTFTPIIQQAISQLESVGAKFEAESLTEATLGVGAFTFIITPLTRAAWVVTDYVIISSIAAPGNGMIARVLDYDRTNGILEVDGLAAIGSGTFSSWRLRVSAPPDLEHATRVDNPHLTTAAQVGAYTIAQIDVALALKAASGHNHDAAYAALSHAHVVSDVTGLQTALDAKGALATAQDWTRPQTAAATAAAHNTAWDASQIQHLTVTVNGSTFTIANPTSIRANTLYLIYVIYTTTHGLGFGSAYKGITALAPTATAGKADCFQFRANAAATELHLVGEKYDVGT